MKGGHAFLTILLAILTLAASVFAIPMIYHYFYPPTYVAEINVKDKGIALVNTTVSLFNSQNEMVCSLNTDSRGLCIFKDLKSGQYLYSVTNNGELHSYSLYVNESNTIIPEYCDVSMPTKVADPNSYVIPVRTDTNKPNTNNDNQEGRVINTLNAPVSQNGTTVSDGKSIPTSEPEPQLSNDKKLEQENQQESNNVTSVQTPQESNIYNNRQSNSQQIQSNQSQVYNNSTTLTSSGPMSPSRVSTSHYPQTYPVQQMSRYGSNNSHVQYQTVSQQTGYHNPYQNIHRQRVIYPMRNPRFYPRQQVYPSPYRNVSYGNNGWRNSRYYRRVR